MGKQKKSEHLWLKKYPQDIPWDVQFIGKPAYELLEESANRFPSRPCIDFLGKKFSYQEVLILVNKVAKGLQNLGVKKGTKVGIFMPNAAYFPIFYFGILKAGGVVVNYSPLYVVNEIADQIRDSDTEMMVTLDLDVLYSKILAAQKETDLKKIIVCSVKDILPFPKNLLFPLLKRKDLASILWDQRHICFKELIDNDGQPKAVKIDPEEDIAVFQYTGGTTGIPKGAMLTHANIYINAQQARMWFSKVDEGNERILAALPLFHVFAMTAIMTLAIRSGAEMFMMFPRFNVDEAMKMIQKHKITFFPAVPTIYTMINNHPDVKKFNLTSLKACLSGGAPLPVEVKKQFEELTGCKLVEAYGLSETSPGATSNPLYALNKAGSIGIPLPGTEVHIMSVEKKNQEVSQGERGEICIKGPQVMKGYWKRPEDTQSVFQDDYFRTGDIGYMDEDGYIFLVDRIKDLIICSGYNVYPRVVEEAIYQHQAVEEVTVIGVPDKKQGESVKAFIKLKTGKKVTAQEIRSFLTDRLSAVEMPRYLEFRDALPKTMIGKLSKKELRAEEVNKPNKKTI
ncbi:MAG: dicarboxylate--CoA ligase PimA [Caedibacter sp. 38-128]|nr:long-chain fatty acid--CoA ligase [Holosporales bacterium]OJX08808.1 MAG: dicarboxylate--CoA ligase PimA [Caedibacter sp. 38-128]